MRKISKWASTNILASRIFIVVIYILLTGLGIYTGILLQELNVVLPGFLFWLIILSALIIFFAYPGKLSKKSRLQQYGKQKSLEFLMGLLTFILVVFSVNTKAKLFQTMWPSARAFSIHIHKDSANIQNPFIAHFITSLKNMDISKLSQKDKIRIIKNQIREIKNDKEMSKGSKVALIILSIFVAIALLIGLAALSCNIACAGLGFLALLVALAGTFVVVFLLIKVIKKITGPKTSTKTEPVPINK